MSDVNSLSDVFCLESYAYDLPEERIAQEPPAVRGASRLMVLDRHEDVWGGAGPAADPAGLLPGDPVSPSLKEACPWLVDTVFERLPEYLPAGALLVANNSRVVPARLFGVRPSGGKAEMLLLTPLPLVEQTAEQTGERFFSDMALAVEGAEQEEETSTALAEVLLRPGKNIRVGDRLRFGPLLVTVLEKKDFGRHKVRLFWTGSLADILEREGRLPLPPYIRREQSAADRVRYQTLYARPDKKGSVAAPTAGLHFTEDMRARLAAAGFGWTEVTLHVGYGTFSPVREADIRSHTMHREYVELSAATAREINAARREGRPVIAVGTTSARTLEGVAAAVGQDCSKTGAGKRAENVEPGSGMGAARDTRLPEEGWQGWTDIFIYPGYDFRVVDGLITNFHLPRSSLLMLVSALAGRERVLAAYAEAVRRNYRFFSYGDAMLIR